MSSRRTHSLETWICSQEISDRLKSIIPRAGYTHSNADDNFIKVQVGAVECAERFAIWMGELGILQDPEAVLSLDDDLQAYFHQRFDEISDALDEGSLRPVLFITLLLTSSLRAVIPYLEAHQDDDGSVPPDKLKMNLGPKQTASSSPDENQIHHIEIISQAITYLFRASALTPAPSHPNFDARAAQATNVRTATSIEDDVNRITEKYPKLARSPKVIVIRTAEAIRKRRWFIEYCRDQKATGAPGWNSSAFQSSGPWMPHQSSGEEKEVSDFSSPTQSNQLSAQLPQLSTLSWNGNSYECPYCFTVQSFNIEEDWR